MVEYLSDINGEPVLLSNEEKLFGKMEDNIFINYVLILARNFIFQNRLQVDKSLHFQKFKQILRSKYTIERHIAIRTQNWETFLAKWEKFTYFQGDPN